MTEETGSGRAGAGRALVLGGVGFLLAGVTLGLVAGSLGPQRTGEAMVEGWVAAHRTMPLTVLARMLHVVFGPVVMPPVVLVTCLLVGRRDRGAAVVLGAVTFTGWASVRIGKVVFARPRPPVEGQLVPQLGFDSFPSGHTAWAAALTAGVLLALRLRGRPTAPAWLVGGLSVVLVGASRVYLGVHHPADVVGSVLFVAGTSSFCAAVMSRWDSRRAGRPLEPDDRVRCS